MIFYKIIISIALFDVLTGVGKACQINKLTSELGMIGIIKHIVFITLACFSMWCLDDFGLTDLKYPTLIAISYPNITSIIANLEIMGIKIPWLNKFVQSEIEKKRGNTQND